MKRLFILLLIALPGLVSAQKNLLSGTTKEIREIITQDDRGIFDVITYTDSAEKVMFFRFENESPLLIAAFYMSDDDRCYRCVYTFKDDSLLVPLVDSIKGAKGWETTSGKLEFINSSRGWMVYFKRDKDNTLSVNFTYTTSNR